jgi:hypothetical protein
MIYLMSYVWYLMSSILHLLMCLSFVMLMYLCFVISFSNPTDVSRDRVLSLLNYIVLSVLILVLVLILIHSYI